MENTGPQLGTDWEKLRRICLLARSLDEEREIHTEIEK